MSQIFRPSPLRPTSAQNFILGVGAMYFDVDISIINGNLSAEEMSEILIDWELSGKGLGATTGDGTFVFDPQIEDIETNDRLTRVIGLMQSHGINASLTTSLQEITFQNLTRIVPTAVIDPVDGSLGATTVILPEHFKTVVWAGLLGSGGLAVIALLNAINVAETTMTMANQDVAAIPVEFVGTAASIDEMQRGPFKIWIFERAHNPLTDTAAKKFSEKQLKVNETVETPKSKEKD